MSTKDIRRLLDAIKPYGYSIERRKQHFRVLDQEGKKLIIFSGSPSDRNWWKNAIRDLQKGGHIK